jgi:hypothetical protein
MKKAVCTVPVQLYDAELAGMYQPGAVLEGEKATLALARYPHCFRPGDPRKKGDRVNED